MEQPDEDAQLVALLQSLYVLFIRVGCGAHPQVTSQTHSILYTVPTMCAIYGITGKGRAAILHTLSLHISVHSSAWVIYEHILTLEDEYMFIWKRKWTGTTWLFLLNRYTLLFITICGVLSMTSKVDLISFLLLLYRWRMLAESFC